MAFKSKTWKNKGQDGATIANSIWNADNANDLENRIQTGIDDLTIRNTQIHFLSRNSDMGDCSLIQTKDKNILIDAGNATTPTEILNYLDTKGITKIDYLIISHYHDDHIGGSGASGLIALLDSKIDFSSCIVLLPHKEIDYTKFVESDTSNIGSTIKSNEELIINALDSRNITYSYPEDLVEIEIDEYNKFKFINCNSENYDDYYTSTIDAYDNDVGFTNYNNFSMCTILTSFKHKVLFSGDIEKLAQSKIYNSIDNIDVYKVEHHGLNLTTDKSYLKFLSPEIAVIMGNDITNGLKKDTYNKLVNGGCSIYNTAVSGNVLVNISYEKISVLSENGEMFDEVSNYTLLEGVAIPSNSDLNDYKTPGIYHVRNYPVCSTIKNKPSVTDGFKLIVERLSAGTNQIRQMVIPREDARSKMFFRNYNATSSTFTKWLSLYPSLNIVTTSFSLLKNITLDTTGSPNRVTIRNGIVNGVMNFLTNEEIAAYEDILSLPGEYIIDHIHSVMGFTGTGEVYPMYLTYGNNITLLRSRKTIPSGTRIYLEFTYVSNYA